MQKASEGVANETPIQEASAFLLFVVSFPYIDLLY